TGRAVPADPRRRHARAGGGADAGDRTVSMIPRLPSIFYVAGTLHAVAASEVGARKAPRINADGDAWEMYDTGDAGNLVTGTLPLARLPSIPSTQITGLGTAAGYNVGTSAGQLHANGAALSATTGTF